ncbi:serine hydrolase domain-containing protein [Trinickia diaoshuihuensis]|uniref:serine hydrolase domain-containing protein n=1 Tax=Trinickia diaoshuihuensis TaxID=2292265 RepID=UPI000E2629DF|nr:serine hydrolase domain-containing protein [Trinickia diaoshuihuensis]
MSSVSALDHPTAAPDASQAGIIDRPAMVSRLDDALDAAIDERRIVGGVVLVAHRGEPVYARAAGFADREAGLPMQIDSRFRLASVTKPIVALATLALAERGALSLDDPLTRWLPSFTPRCDDGAEPVITVHHLLTHTAGLDYGFRTEPGSTQGLYHRLGISDGLDLVDFDLDENVRRIAQAPLGFAPGTAHRYSVAYDVLGAVIERVTGQSLPAAIETLVTGPLGMRSAAFGVPPGTPLVVPYVDAQPEPRRMSGDTAARLPREIGHCVKFSPQRAYAAHAFPSGGAGMIGSAPDVLTLFETIRRGGAPIVESATIARMMQPHVRAQAQTVGPGWGFGYGWAVLEDPALDCTPQSKGTIQWGGVYGHSWFVDPSAELTVVALTNAAFEGMCGPFTLHVRDAVYGACAASPAR